MTTPHILLVDARVYAEISDELARGAIAELDRHEATYDRVSVPGALEIPGAIRFAIKGMDLVGSRRRYDGYVALGCVIRGETSHYDIVAGESARGLIDLTLEFTIAVGNGILTVDNREQAWARAAVAERNKGAAAAAATVQMIQLKQHFGYHPR